MPVAALAFGLYAMVAWTLLRLAKKFLSFIGLWLLLDKSSKCQ
jgi:hypothetical protein